MSFSMDFPKIIIDCLSLELNEDKKFIKVALKQHPICIASKTIKQTLTDQGEIEKKIPEAI